MYNKSFITGTTKTGGSGEETMKRLLVKALKNRFNMTKEDAIALTKTVEEIFNGEKEIEDMSIDKYSRALFYELQRERLLKLRREEYKDEFNSKTGNWKYAIRGYSDDEDKELRIIVAFKDPLTMVITVIDLEQ